mgnify:CR=1 FL=1
MKGTVKRTGSIRRGGRGTAAVLSCLFAAGLGAQTVTAQTGPETAGVPTSGYETPALSPALSLIKSAPPLPADGAPLRLRLEQPLSLQALGRSLADARGRSRSATTRLNYRLDDALDLHAGMSLAESGTFHALGSIHCQNGVLDAMSYRATDCTFVDEGAGALARGVMMGASFDVAPGARASINLFQRSAEARRPFQPGAELLGAAALLDPFSAIYAGDNALVPGFSPLRPGAARVDAERTGIDLEFQVGFSTDRAGDLVLGLQLTRVLDSSADSVFYASPGARNWTIAEPYDAARLSLGWQQGRFSGGIDSYYRSPIELAGGSALDDQATFDVHFSWRAPWNASLSVGAANVLGAGADESTATEASSADPFESIYGRIPYVRYKQDL